MRYLFMFIVALGNIFLIKNFSLSFFLFNLLVFAVLFFPYSSYISSLGRLFFVPLAVLVCSYIFLFGVSFIHSKELSKSHPNTVKSKISKKQSVLVRLEKKRKENRANAKLKPKHAAEIKKLILKPTRASFTKDPIHWYKSYFMGIYKASLGMVQYNLYAMFFMVLLVLIYTVYLLSSKIPLIACTYAFFAFLLLPALFHVNYQFFLHNAVKYQIVNISLFAMIFLLSYIKLNRFRV